MYYSRLKALKSLEDKKPKPSQIALSGKTPQDVFGEDVFGENQMRDKLPPHTWDSFKKCTETDEHLDLNVADQIANAMKEWALTKHATHYTHWFQPLTGLTAEKHDSFISFTGQSMKMNFSGKQLIKGEPDASSFPSGGIRSTFEARGYTAWDMGSPSFIRSGPNGSFLCIPSAFASWTGEALDMKTPLLRSNEVLSHSAIRVLRLLGDNQSTHVWTNLGVEQEFFVIDRGFYLARPDLISCGRTLQGAQPSKGQQMEDHYFGALERRILSFLQDVEWRLWKLAVPTTTRHNEVAPSQYEVAPIFEKSSLACDHNMLTMEILKETAREHDFICLLHEKPFAGVNGSGKHNNWSMSTNTGVNLMEPGHTPSQNTRFMVFLAAVVRAISIHGDVLRASIAVPGNDHRLGANEAPPAIISIFMGDMLTQAIDDLISSVANVSGTTNTPQKQASTLQLGVKALPNLPRDASDRNRTSPFAFTGNKFEFRAVGSSQSCARPVFFLNSIVAESLNVIADAIEAQRKLTPDMAPELAATLVAANFLKEHKRVIFNGNGYSEEWKQEAHRRGLWNLRTVPEALQQLASEKNVKLFEGLGILSKTELQVQQHTLYEIFCKSIAIESDTLLSMASSQILPVALEYKKNVTMAVDNTQQPQSDYLASLSNLVSKLIQAIDTQKGVQLKAKTFHEDQLHEQAAFYRNEVMEAMGNTRVVCDELEKMVDDRLWPFPKYSEMLFLK